MTASVRSSAASGDLMPKMTPEQEAAYALDFDVSRAACRQPRRKPTTGCWNSAAPANRESPSRERTPSRPGGWSYGMRNGPWPSGAASSVLPAGDRAP
jgi:hypothetical protein